MPETNPTTALTLIAHEGEPRIRDVDLADRLGFDRPRDIRKLIARHADSLAELGPRATVARVINGGEATEHLLNKKQAIFITAKSETPAATEITIEIIERFDAYERGLIGAGTTPPLTHDQQLAEVREARLTFGRLAAQRVWHDVGLRPLSMVPAEPRQSSMFDAPAADRPTLADLPALSRPRSARTLTADLLARIDARVAAGATIRAACEAEGANYQTVRNKTHLMRAAARHQH